VHPLHLLESLADAVKDDYFSVGILECNQAAIESVRSVGFIATTRIAPAHVLGESDQLGKSPSIIRLARRQKAKRGPEVTYLVPVFLEEMKYIRECQPLLYK